MRCVTTYDPSLNAMFWGMTYLLTLSAVILGVLIIYDLLATDFDLFPTVYLFLILGLILALIWSTWRRGLFLGSDFRSLVREMGGAVLRGPNGLRGDFGAFVIDAKVGHYLRGGAPFPSWHQSPLGRRPCGDPECMLCDSTFAIKSTKGAGLYREKRIETREIIGGTWEGVKLRNRLEVAVAQFASEVRTGIRD